MAAPGTYLTKESSAAIAAWAARQPNNQAYVNAVVLAWSESDPDGTRAWLADLPAPTKDAALKKIVDQAANWVPVESTFKFESHFEGAAAWTAQINDPQTREALYEKLAASWLEFEADSAQAWLEQAPIPADVKARLLAKNQKKDVWGAFP